MTTFEQVASTNVVQYHDERGDLNGNSIADSVLLALWQKFNPSDLIGTLSLELFDCYEFEFLIENDLNNPGLCSEEFDLEDMRCRMKIIDHVVLREWIYFYNNALHSLYC